MTGLDVTYQSALNGGAAFALEGATLGVGNALNERFQTARLKTESTYHHLKSATHNIPSDLIYSTGPERFEMLSNKTLELAPLLLLRGTPIAQGARSLAKAQVQLPKIARNPFGFFKDLEFSASAGGFGHNSGLQRGYIGSGKSQIVEGLGRPFRKPNRHFPPDSNILREMKKLPIHSDAFDCSEIADRLFDFSNEAGRKLKITSREKYKFVKVPESKNEKIIGVDYDYHYVYEKSGYVYDPRATLNAIPKGDYMSTLKRLNKEGFILEQERFLETGITLSRIRP
jgi:hypothetical protein